MTYEGIRFSDVLQIQIFQDMTNGVFCERNFETSDLIKPF
jgi:hypothetical protein